MEKLSKGARAALLAANTRGVIATAAEKEELIQAGLVGPNGHLNVRGRSVRRMVFQEMEDEAFG